MEKESASKYQEIVDYLTEKMQSGAYREHDRLPTEQELSEQFEVSRPTVVRAMEFLRSAGLVYRIQGKGTFAASDSGNARSRSFRWCFPSPNTETPPAWTRPIY